jgi:hypothetical protein
MSTENGSSGELWQRAALDELARSYGELDSMLIAPEYLDAKKAREIDELIGELELVAKRLLPEMEAPLNHLRSIRLHLDQLTEYLASPVEFVSGESFHSSWIRKHVDALARALEGLPCNMPKADQLVMDRWLIDHGLMDDSGEPTV